MNEPSVYAWAVEFPSRTGGPTQVAFFPNDGRYDVTYATNYATRMHGRIVPLVRASENTHDGQAQ